MKPWRITWYALPLSSLQEVYLVCCTAKCLHTPGQGRQREREGSWEGCQPQPEGADGDAVLGLEKCSEWEAPKESSDIEKGWKQSGKEEKVLFATVCKHQEFQHIGRLYLVYTEGSANGGTTEMGSVKSYQEPLPCPTEPMPSGSRWTHCWPSQTTQRW